MIHVENKRYRVGLWVDEDRTGSGLELQFDALPKLSWSSTSARAREVSTQAESCSSGSKTAHNGC